MEETVFSFQDSAEKKSHFTERWRKEQQVKALQFLAPLALRIDTKVVWDIQAVPAPRAGVRQGSTRGAEALLRRGLSPRLGCSASAKGK